ncbi:MAG: SDR family oxidoreductase [Desulfobacterales bacterium]|nr:SDR family oxidoreductase [Desulfobacterales bacterium]MDJ0856923.1 SDR family oxidoreductase [Desulfobacterales bacterium]MDJ0888733.1 SDR family oxidoreductase [Desulfobacterales bacterium]
MGNKNALVVGIRDEDSIVTAIAAEIKRAGYDIYATYQDESTHARVSRVAEAIGIRKLFTYDALKDEDLGALTAAVKKEGITLDALVHGISYSTAEGAKLDLPLVEVTWEDFTDAIRVGAFSLVEIAGGLVDVLREDAAILAVTLRWSQVAVPRFNVVGATKAALESIIRGLAQSLGNTKKIRVNAISPGFVSTYSLSKVGNRLDILEQAKAQSPLRANVRKEDIASLAVSILENRSVTGMIYPIDAGASIVAN